MSNFNACTTEYTVMLVLYRVLQLHLAVLLRLLLADLSTAVDSKRVLNFSGCFKTLFA